MSQVWVEAGSANVLGICHRRRYAESIPQLVRSIGRRLTTLTFGAGCPAFRNQRGRNPWPPGARDIAGNIAQPIQPEGVDASTANLLPTPSNNLEEVQAAFCPSIQAPEGCLQGVSEQRVLGPWRLTAS